VIFLRFKIETLEYYFAKYLINKGIKSVVQIPLSPQKACFKRNIKTKNPVNRNFYRVFYVYIFLFRNPQNNYCPNILDLILDLMEINF
jgi:hypothetical protein